MKKLLLIILISFFCSFSLCAQEKPQQKNEYQFTVIKELPVTAVKNQSATGTCWCFAAVSFIESELIRTGKGEFDLSEMFIVHQSYCDKADKYIRTNGNINFTPGGCFGDVFTVFKNYGIVPQEIMSGLNYGTKNHIHKEMDMGLAGYINALLKNPNRKYTPAWKEGLKGILNAYLGEIPQKFNYKGKEYTPRSFAAELSLNPDYYVSITSFLHHPFYQQFALEIPDNWRWDLSYNVPIDDLMTIIDSAIEKGHSILWATDVSERGFKSKGIAVVPETEIENMPESDQSKWVGLPKNKLNSKLFSLEQVVPEKKITQEERQIAFDNGQTTDDHGMHIYGIAKDQNGNKYYMVKNSWGDSGDYKGTWYVSETYVKYKTTNIMVHKNTVPKEIKNKLGL